MRLIEKLPLLAHMLPNEREKMLEIATTQMCVPRTLRTLCTLNTCLVRECSMLEIAAAQMRTFAYVPLHCTATATALHCTATALPARCAVYGGFPRVTNRSVGRSMTGLCRRLRPSLAAGSHSVQSGIAFESVRPMRGTDRSLHCLSTGG